ncbi:hypothetical protein L249_0141 [Ophiocordyceps polyrhachis-furcata BCC 54312]|uniref:Glycosyl transferase CAP10 domain-containing protein n=1 Tax=Ophiocordyceps polyrhachis-furcata BCC 54312 TaxID=1330021 RepID=A0A367LD70_9HYPO|nr:hypothetical protein L249_0141 [Ophiocordyceps polyrhachis-furcata BCC 54312]
MGNKLLSSTPFRRRPSTRYTVIAAFLLLALYAFNRSSREIYINSSTIRHRVPFQSSPPAIPADNEPLADGENSHPIDKLMYDAQRSFAKLISSESKSLDEAAQAYRMRRGRHPPPGFDKWYEFARSHNALIVEDFFDQIYHDLEPFWDMDPLNMRRQASQFEMTINIRNGSATAGSDWFWTQIWLKMVKEIQKYLPDMDIALNAMDEPRIVAAWENVNKHVTKAAKSRRLPRARSVISDFQKLPDPNKAELAAKVPDIDWDETEPYWLIARRGCSPNSLARTKPLQTSFAEPPIINNDYANQHLYRGYVSNYTKSNDICHQPDLQGLQGLLIKPLTTKATDVLFPLFGGSKLTVNNEILLPAPMYWSEEERFTGGEDRGAPWASKANQVVWRGVATGGRNEQGNWRGFQRHRFVAMNNGTKISLAESGVERPENFALAQDSYQVKAQRERQLGRWIDDISNVAFTDLFCDYPQDGGCNYTDFYFDPRLALTLAIQFDYKYLPDIDGNSFSGRYLGFLRSTSLPIKASVWREWHDSRLVPWKHFVPMDNRFSDYYGILDYFIGFHGRDGHDQAAEKIASDGKEWAERVLRKEDMLIYVMRLLLEYARVLDSRRESMGWVQDLLKDPSLEKEMARDWSWLS